MILSLLSGVRTEEARALRWSEVDLDTGTVAVYRSVRAKGDTKTRKISRLKPNELAKPDPRYLGLPVRLPKNV